MYTYLRESSELRKCNRDVFFCNRNMIFHNFPAKKNEIYEFDLKIEKTNN